MEQWLILILPVMLATLWPACARAELTPTPPPTFTSVAPEVDRPSFIKVSDCSVLAQTAIQDKGLPIDAIHYCQEELVVLDTGEDVSLIRISYGQPMVCSTGCVYNPYIGLFVGGHQTLVDLPRYGEPGVENGVWSRPPFNVWRTWGIDNYYSKSHVDVGLRDGHYGWLLVFENHNFTALGSDGNLPYRRYESTGEVFVYLDSSGKEIWGFSQFQTTEAELQ